jgi:hypothetical protein
MKRRNFLLLTTAGAIATMTPFCKSARAEPNAFNTPDFLGAICDSQTIRRIGTDYRASTPAEAKASQLTEQLEANLDQNKDQTEQLEAKIKADFAAGRTITLEGWVLSRTEARQCALYSIQNP